ncbi:MAG: type II toxin-antitoxin system Phd/YefM family antitoxin [Candidatus Electrothrix sp. MAN1_4]|nr:type II toxin-antitoxin system Phd/YefM family antitoxin [Candidatus Electrothrix sp. MAN1_4]
MLFYPHFQTITQQNQCNSLDHEFPVLCTPYKLMEEKMKQIDISNDIVPIAEFKGQILKYLKDIRSSGRPMVITQNGKPADVLISQCSLY